MRLRTLPVSVAGVVAATGLAIADGCFRPVPAFICLVFALLCQTASNFANEYYDYRAGRDQSGREGPRRGVTEGDLSPRAMKRSTFGLLAVAAALGLTLTWWGGAWLIAAGALIGLGALAYSAGPFPLSTHCLGEVAVIFFFGIVPVNLTYYVQADTFSVQTFMASVAVGLMGANVLIVNNTRDIPDDRACGKHTLATATSPRTMSLVYIVNAALAAALTWDCFRGAWMAVPAVYFVSADAIAFKLASLTGKELNPLLGKTAISMFAYSVVMTLSLAL